MISFLTTGPLWLTAFLVVGSTTAIAMLGPGLVRRFVTLEHLTANNEIAGFKFATVGVLYAVFLAFTIIVVWERYNDSNASVAREASAAATIYHLSAGLDDAQGNALRAALTAYLKSAISNEWPAMDRGAHSEAAHRAIGDIYKVVLATNQFEKQDTALRSEIFYQLDVLTQARRARLIAVEGAVPGVIWVVLFAGAAVTIGFTFFFGTQNLRAQIMMTGLLSILIFSELLIIVMLDRPFSGAVKIGTDALEEVVTDHAEMH